MKKYQQNKNYFQSLLTLPEERLTKETKQSKWSIREIIGHIYYWDKFLLDVMVPQMSEGASLPEFPDHDAYNEKAMLHIAEFSTTRELLAEFTVTREHLLHNLNELPEDTSFTIGKGKRIFTPEKFLEMFVEHDDHHIKQIEAFLKQQNIESC
ncbi:DinB family protein [Bacillus tianshenii]|uniref:DinB family protein n=1 Tax=Sutcliffiella tianshenii TaxID=1463404 RepID=UPI001CD46A20|nr:DinB family protein [Bacillus tianshenii]MCA1319350.1 DinB family protein [Bacillus tianshenii]